MIIKASFSELFGFLKHTPKVQTAKQILNTDVTYEHMVIGKITLVDLDNDAIYMDVDDRYRSEFAANASFEFQIVGGACK